MLYALQWLLLYCVLTHLLLLTAPGGMHLYSHFINHWNKALITSHNTEKTSFKYYSRKKKKKTGYRAKHLVLKPSFAACFWPWISQTLITSVLSFLKWTDKKNKWGKICESKKKKPHKITTNSLINVDFLESVRVDF